MNYKKCLYCPHLKYGHRKNTVCPKKVVPNIKLHALRQSKNTNLSLNEKCAAINEWWKKKDESTPLTFRPNVKRDTFKKKVYKAEAFMFDISYPVKKTEIYRVISEISKEYNIQIPDIVFTAPSLNEGTSQFMQVEFFDAETLDLQIVLHEMAHQIEVQSKWERLAAHSLIYINIYEDLIRKYRSENDADSFIQNLQESGVPTNIEEFNLWFTLGLERNQKVSESKRNAINKSNTGYILERALETGEIVYHRSLKYYTFSKEEAKVFRRKETAEKVQCRKPAYDIVETAIIIDSSGQWKAI